MVQSVQEGLDKQVKVNLDKYGIDRDISELQKMKQKKEQGIWPSRK